MFSGGLASYWAARRVVEQNGKADVTLLFADTKIEDPDLYRFLEEASADVGIEVTWVAEGRTPWQVFFDERFLGNTRVDPCSRLLKREVLGRWLEDNCAPADTLIAMGFDWSEGHRMAKMNQYGGQWERWAPLLKPPLLTKLQMANLCRERGIEPPRLYGMGFQHNNCGGTCVKAGQAAWAMVLRELPERYSEWEAQEEALSAHLGKQVTILRDRKGGHTKQLSLRAFREQLQSGQQYDMMDWGTCGCLVTEEAL